MTAFSQQLLQKIRRVATEFPTAILDSAIAVLATDGNWSDFLIAKLLHQLSKASLRSLIMDLIETW
ncbi:MAG: hypothetical protein KME01_07315 [Chroococcus sp. CMT-3BRIN-NPC107]|jgi:hypothetical protein|nr:hypothetical protein [Chroococcus sp. CMT-3BRIN-NPC107]